MLISFAHHLVGIKYSILVLFFIFLFLSLFWSKIFNFFNLKPYTNIQRVHLNEVPRIGGLLIYFFAWFLCLREFTSYKFLFNLLISAIPFVLISLKEDLLHNTSARLRIFSMAVSCLIFFYLNPLDFPLIDAPFIGKYLQIGSIGIIFFSFSVIIIMNGMNLLDGMNGLFAFTASAQLLSIIFLSFIFSDFEIFEIASLLIIPLALFILFNYFFGSIFIGDLGAYLYGFFISLLIIKMFGSSYMQFSWLAVLILFYPSAELLFSYFRKLKNGKSPFEADNNHLHTLAYKKILQIIKFNKLSNALTTLSLSAFWVIPFIISVYFYDSLTVILFSIIILFLIYLFFYNLLNNK